MTTAYRDFLAGKRSVAPTVGIEVDLETLPLWLFPFQRDLVKWALRKGRAAIFADTGLGKTRMQLAWARPIWYGIRETDTLQKPPKANDERHVAPLQLGVIERCVRLWSNRGETVLSPFAGIGSEGYEAIRQGRRFIGVELKPEYFRVAAGNLRKAEELAEGQLDLFGTTGREEATA
jgi:DNA modification methylase